MPDLLFHSINLAGLLSLGYIMGVLTGVIR